MPMNFSGDPDHDPYLSCCFFPMIASVSPTALTIGATIIIITFITSAKEVMFTDITSVLEKEVYLNS